MPNSGTSSPYSSTSLRDAHRAPRIHSLENKERGAERIHRQATSLRPVASRIATNRREANPSRLGLPCPDTLPRPRHSIRRHRFRPRKFPAPPRQTIRNTRAPKSRRTDRRFSDTRSLKSTPKQTKTPASTPMITERRGRYERARSRNRHQAGEHSVACHGDIRLAEQEVPQQHRCR